jgi:glycosyltransferase involved in cell wall biosynthesis
VAQLCRKYSIPLIFAGPIQAGYPLMDYVDGDLIKYIGIISNSEKSNYYKKALLTTYLHFWQTPFNISAIESLSYGTPIMATANGFWPKLIKNKINGYIIATEEDFVNSINDCLNIKQIDCYNSSSEYSSEKMVSSFYLAFNNILYNP